MSNANAVAKRYAKALWQEASDSSADAFAKNLDALVELVEGSPQLKTLAKSPIFSSEEKLKVFSEIFEKLSFSKELVSFLKLLIENDRFSVLAEVQKEFRLLHMNARNTKEALVETAFELTESQTKQLTQVLEAGLDTRVNLKVRVNAALVAGIVVHVDGQSIDASLTSNLNGLKRELLSAEA